MYLSKEQIKSIIPSEDSEGESVIEKIVRTASQHCDAYDEWLESFIDNPIPERIFQAPYEVVLAIQDHFKTKPPGRRSAGDK